MASSPRQLSGAQVPQHLPTFRNLCAPQRNRQPPAPSRTRPGRGLRRAGPSSISLRNSSIRRSRAIERCAGEPYEMRWKLPQQYEHIGRPSLSLRRRTRLSHRGHRKKLQEPPFGKRRCASRTSRLSSIAPKPSRRSSCRPLSGLRPGAAKRWARPEGSPATTCAWRGFMIPRAERRGGTRDEDLRLTLSQLKANGVDQCCWEIGIHLKTLPLSTRIELEGCREKGKRRAPETCAIVRNES